MEIKGKTLISHQIEEIVELERFKTPNWDTQLTKYGLQWTIENFCSTQNKKWSRLRIMVDYSFAHIVLGDYNLEDASIDFCLDEMWTWFYDQYQSLLDTNYNSNNYWENYNWFSLCEVTDNIIVFLNWLKTLPEEIRYAN